MTVFCLVASENRLNLQFSLLLELWVSDSAVLNLEMSKYVQKQSKNPCKSSLVIRTMASEIYGSLLHQIRIFWTKRKIHVYRRLNRRCSAFDCVPAKLKEKKHRNACGLKNVRFFFWKRITFYYINYSVLQGFLRLRNVASKHT